MADDKFASNIENILKKASEEILTSQNGSCFTVDQHTESEESYMSAYDRNELAEFINYDMLGEEGDHMECFSNLITNTNHEDLTGDRKVLKILLDAGVGQVVPENSIVMIHYIAYISNLHEPFDVTYLQGRRPRRFALSSGELLPGLEIGIKTMTLGENARFIIKPELAYKELGCPPRIPPNATVLFDVNLVSYMSPENCLRFDENDRDPERFKKNLDLVKKLHVEGNEQFKIGNLLKAIHKYERAKELLHIAGCNSDVEENLFMKLLSKLYTNLSLCYLKQCAFNKVCRMGMEAMKYSERYSKHSTKLYFNWGKALRLLKDFTEAKKKLQKALKIEPHNVTIHNEMHRLEKDRQFISNVQSFTLDDADDNNERLPPEFWEVFNTRLTEFVENDEDVLTVTLNKNADDIELVKRKASLNNLKCHIIIKAGVETNCIAIQKCED